MRAILAERRWAWVLALAVAYTAAGKLGLLLAIPPGFATAIWPPSGIALAALLLGGRRLWPGIWLGSFTVNLLTSYDSADPESLWRSLLLAASLGAGASLQGVVAASLVRGYVRASQPLEERDVLSLMLWGGPVGCLVGASWGATSLFAAGLIDSSGYLFNWGTWWVGDTIGVLIMTPLVLLWSRPSQSWRQRLSVTFPMVITFALAVVLFVYTSRSEENTAREAFEDQARNLSASIAATPEYLKAHRDWSAWMVLAGGLLFTSLLQAFLLVLTSRAAKVEALVVQRTGELRQELAERRRAESVLRVSEARHRALLDHMLAALVTADRQGRIESVNPAGERMFGYREEELVGRSVAVLLADAPESDPQPFLEQAYRNSLGRVTEWWGRRRNGEVFPFEIALYSFEAPEGERIAGNLLDISERREVERLKSEFVATVSHELRTPLTSIRGSLGLLAAGAAGSLPPQVRELLRVAERNSIRLTSLINDILDFERLESGSGILHLAGVPLQRIFTQAQEAVRELAQRNEVTLRIAAPSPLQVMADEGRLVQVLVNLLSNAVKFSPPGSEVVLEALPLEGRVRINVADQGRGIPASQRKRIFERFVQVESADQIEKGGTGLGLAICKTIVERHGGLIGVDSAPGAGSTFWIELPALPGDGSAEA